MVIFGIKESDFALDKELHSICKPTLFTAFCLTEFTQNVNILPIAFNYCPCCEDVFLLHTNEDINNCSVGI